MNKRERQISVRKSELSVEERDRCGRGCWKWKIEFRVEEMLERGR